METNSHGPASQQMASSSAMEEQHHMTDTRELWEREDAIKAAKDTRFRQEDGSMEHKKSTGAYLEVRVRTDRINILRAFIDNLRNYFVPYRSSGWHADSARLSQIHSKCRNCISL